MSDVHSEFEIPASGGVTCEHYNVMSSKTVFVFLRSFFEPVYFILSFFFKTQREMAETSLDSGPFSETNRKEMGLSPMHDEIVHGLTVLHNQYSQLSESDIEKIRLAGSLNIRHRLNYRQRVYAFTFMVSQLIDFFTRLPGFDKLYHEDQVALMKNCVNRVLLLRLAETYDADSDTIYFAQRPYTQDNFHVLDMGIPTMDMFDFCRQMNEMKVDCAGYALLTAITIFSVSGCESLRESWKVQRIHEIYKECLEAYINRKHTLEGGTSFTELISAFFSLEILVNSHLVTDSYEIGNFVHGVTGG